MDSWLHDVRHSLRALARQPGFVVVAVLSLALGIGVNTAIFSAINALLLKPLAVRELDRTVYVVHADATHPDRGTSFAAFERYRDRTDTFSAVMAFAGARPLIMTDGDRREQVYAELVTGAFFSIADVTFAPVVAILSQKAMEKLPEKVRAWAGRVRARPSVRAVCESDHTEGQRSSFAA